MAGKISFALGAAVGYVLGARAGRDRYEQLKAQADSLRNNPQVQAKVSQATQAVKDKAPEVQSKLTDAASSAAGSAKSAAGSAADKTKSAASGAANKVSSHGNDTDAAQATGTGYSGSDDNFTGSEPGSDYTPHETKFNSAD